MLERVCRKGRPPTLLVGMWADAVTTENSIDSSEKLKIELPYDLAIPLLGRHPDKTVIQKDTCNPYPYVHSSTTHNRQHMETEISTEK